jgi:hypothetical protein
VAKYFRHIKDDGHGSIDFPGVAGKHGQSLIGLLYLEARYLSGGERASISIDDCDTVVGAVQRLVSANAANWIDSALDDVPMHPKNRSAIKKALAYNDHDEGISGSMAALGCSPVAVQVIYDSLCDSPLPDDLSRIPVGRIMAMYGLYFMDCFIDESINRDTARDFILLREIHLQQAGEALSVACLNRAGDEAEDEHRAQKKQAGKARDAQKYEPLRSHAIALYEDGAWKSTRQAAIAIFPKVLALAKEKSLYLSGDRAQTTVYEWLLAHIKGQK